MCVYRLEIIRQSKGRLTTKFQRGVPETNDRWFETQIRLDYVSMFASITSAIVDFIKR